MIGKNTKLNTLISVILYILSLAFFLYGIYMIDYSINFIKNYQSDSAVAFENTMRYVVENSVIYFFFSLIFFISAQFLNNFNNVHRDAEILSEEIRKIEESLDGKIENLIRASEKKGYETNLDRDDSNSKTSNVSLQQISCFKRQIKQRRKKSRY